MNMKPRALWSVVLLVCDCVLGVECALCVQRACQQRIVELQSELQHSRSDGSVSVSDSTGMAVKVSQQSEQIETLIRELQEERTRHEVCVGVWCCCATLQLLIVCMVMTVCRTRLAAL